MYTPILLALPFLAPALGHTIPRHAARGHHVHAARVDTPVERGIPKAHFGLPPSSSDLSGVAGFKRDENDTDAHVHARAELVKNVEARSYPKGHFGLPPTDGSLAGVAGFKRDGSGSGSKKLVRRRKRSCAAKPNASASASASSSLGSNLNAHPSYSSAVAAASPTSTSSEAEWDDSTHGVPAATSASAVTSQSSVAAASSTWSSAAAAESTSASTSPLGGLMAFVFPRGKGTADWSTVVDDVAAMSIDSALNPLSAGKLPSLGQAPDGSTALIANYPANSVKLASPGHGYSFYTSGSHDNVYVEGAKEVMFSYSVFFQDGFQFVKGGKLPGLYGGTSAETAKSCSGGRQDNRDECFSARLMWRRDGAGEIYNYLPSAAYSNPNYCSYPPYSLCDAKYGESIGRGAFTFPTGQWTTLAIRLKMNDAGVSNGEQELFVNGNSVISLTDLLISNNAQTKIYGIMAQTFFGGSDQSWASPIDQSAYFKDWSLAVLA